MAITEEDIRIFLQDQAVEQNPLDMDLSFSSSDILAAMQRVCMDYNELPPLVRNHTDPSKLPHKSFLLHGIVRNLYLSELARMSRNRVEYNAGNMVVDPDKARIDWFREAVALHTEAFQSGARTEKIEHNLHSAYGHYNG
jgi:hypothetical protein